MSISDKDSKALWGKAAGRCSIPNCRKELTLDKELANEIILFGEMCHIVGEKNNIDSPRGLHIMPLKDRNKYENLILLCCNHHTIIDKDVDYYTIEKLLEIKKIHEDWVDINLESKSDPLEDFYSMIMNSLEKKLMFNRWNHFSIHALRSLINGDFIDALDDINYMKLKIHWADEINKEFKMTVMNLINSYIYFIEHFLKYSLYSNGIYRPDKTYKRKSKPDEYHFFSRRCDLWMRMNYCNLLDYTVKLNEYLLVIRKILNPLYLINFGYFHIEDELGTFNRGEPVMYIPTKDFAKRNLVKVKRDIKIFEKEYKIEY